ncbi:beta strand repeat-containing protein, partial [Listeria booriae]
MINKKRANKVTKLTVASAIAFTTLAQPLGNVITTKAAEAPATTKAESKLLQSTTSNENSSKNLKSNLKASKTVIENPNLTFDTSTGTIPGWNVGIRGYTYEQEGELIKGLFIVKDTSSSGMAGGWYEVETPANVTKRQFLLRGKSGGGVEVTYSAFPPFLSNATHNVVYQTINTVPGEEYTFSYRATTKLVQFGNTGFGKVGINVVDDETEAKISSSLDSIPADNVERNYSTTFTARSSKTRVEMISTRVNQGLAMSVTIAGGVSITPTDTTPPDAPNVTPVYDIDTTIKGSGEANCDVKVTLPSGDIVTGRTDGSGNFNITIPAQAAGKQIQVTLTDGAGNESSPTTVTVLASAISKPTIDTAITTDSIYFEGRGVPNATVQLRIGNGGWSNEILVTGDSRYFFDIAKQPFGTEISVRQTLRGVTSDITTTTVTQGNVAAPTIDAVKSDDETVTGTGITGATVTVAFGNQERTAQVIDGKYTVSIPKQAAGTEITAKQTLNGKTSDSVKTTVTQGTVAAPTIGQVTTDDTTVKGTGINGATVTVKVGGQEYPATVTDGEYSVTIPKQAFGTEITAKQTLNGQTSSAASTTVTQGTVSAPAIDAVTTDDETVKGTGIVGATVTVKVGSQEYTATVDQDGKYSITISKQAFGTEITAKQTLNGKTSSNATITVTQGTVAPPTINPVVSDDTTVKGSCLPGATVTVIIGGQEYPATVTNNEYSATIPKQASGTIISAKQTLNGKTSNLATTTVGQGTVAAPTINSLTSDDTTASGTGITGAVVTITIGSLTYNTTVVNGNYSVTIPKQAAGTVVYAKQTLFGQTSDNAQTTVTQGSIAAPTINAVTTDSTTVSGTGLNGATVTVKVGSQDYTATVANNAYSITIPKQAFGTEITAKQSLNGKTSDEANTTVTQGNVANPAINAVTSDDTTVTGSGITGATVTLTIGDQDYQGTVTNGTYTITIPKQAAGTVISGKQTLNGKTSGSVSVTVTQGTLAAPTINDFTVGDAYVTGTAPAGATKVALYVGDQFLRYAAVTDGKYRVYAADNASMGVAGTAFQVASVDAAGTIGAKASSTVKPSTTVAAPTINDFYVGDVYAKGTATGANKVTLYINGVAVRTAAVAANGTYSIYTGDRASLAIAGNTFQVEASNAAGKTSTKTTGTVKAKLAAPTINDFYAGDAYAKGTAAGGANKVTLYIDGVAVRQAAVAADGSYSIYTGDRATLATAGNTFQIESSAPTGETSAKTTGTVKAKETVAAPTINDFYVGDAYAKGTATGANKVTLYINGVAVRTAAVAANGTYSIYTGDRASLAIAGNTFQVEASNAAGKTSTKTTGTVKAKLAAPTINDFYAGDAYAKGTAAGGANKVTLYIDGVAVRQAAVAADGSYSIYTGDRATLATAGNTFQIESSAPTGETSAKTTGTVKAKETVAAPTINDFYVGDAYAKGIATGANKVTLYVNNVAIRQAAVAADGTYTIYTGDQTSLATAGNTFQIQAVKASGATSVKTTGTVKAKETVAAPTINDFYVGDAYAKG